MNIKGTKKKNQVKKVNIFEQQETIAKAKAIKGNLKASTWYELETYVKFGKNAKFTFISDFHSMQRKVWELGREQV